MSMKAIARAVGVSVSSVSLWVRDIELTQEQHEALRRANPAYNRQLAGHASNRARALTRRREYQEHGRRLARRGDPFHAAGCMLFWAEGGRNRNAVRFSNSDPAMVRFFVRFLRTYFAIPDEKFRVWCNLHADHVARQREVEDFWLGVAELPRTCLTKSTVNVYSKYTRRKRTNMLPYRTCRVSVGSTRIVQTLYGSIQEYAGFEREQWVR
jgi:hypothetical protein